MKSQLVAGLSFVLILGFAAAGRAEKDSDLKLLIAKVSKSAAIAEKFEGPKMTKDGTKLPKNWVVNKGELQLRDGSLAFVASEGTVVPGPLLQIGNTTSRVDFGRDPGEWVDDWAATGVGHHWSLSLGHRSGAYRAAASLLGIDFRQVS